TLALKIIGPAPSKNLISAARLRSAEDLLACRQRDVADLLEEIIQGRLAGVGWDSHHGAESLRPTKLLRQLVVLVALFCHCNLFQRRAGREAFDSQGQNGSGVTEQSQVTRMPEVGRAVFRNRGDGHVKLVTGGRLEGVVFAILTGFVFR